MQICKQCIVQGSTGSGKSALIMEMVRRITAAFGADAVAVAAPTGIAAVNINGVTCHNKFKLPRVNSQFAPLKGIALRNFQTENKILKFVIIDEMSMLSSQKHHQIESRLSQLRPNSAEDYGGLCIYFIGDFKQLPPVLEEAVYDSNPKGLDAVHRIELFNKIEKVVQLTTIHRQQGNKKFAKALEKIATTKINMKDYSWLST